MDKVAEGSNLIERVKVRKRSTPEPTGNVLEVPTVEGTRGEIGTPQEPTRRTLFVDQEALTMIKASIDEKVKQMDISIREH